MDTPPSITLIERIMKGSHQITSQLKQSTYVPRFQWNDDERSTKGYVPTYHDCDREDKYMEYIPVFKVMKEYYDEEKRALCRHNSWSSFGESDDMEYVYDTWTDGEGGSDYDNVPPSAPLSSTQLPCVAGEVPQEETSEIPLDAGANKFMYT
jgi:hypothetical protein